MHQEKLLRVVTKYTLLTVCAVVTTQIFIFISAMTSLLTFSMSELGVTHVICYYLYYFVWLLDCLISAVCIYLNFKMNDGKYYAICVIDDCCLRLYLNLSKKTMVKAKITNRMQSLHEYLLTDLGMESQKEPIKNDTDD